MGTVQLNIEGHLDRCDASGFGGWVVDRDNPLTRLQLSVCNGTALLDTCVANRFRQDLADAGLSNGNCAFRFELPGKLSASELHALKIKIDGTGYFFPVRVGPPVREKPGEVLYRQVAADLWRSGRHWRKFKTCILHIGTEKTGTTSLQTFFGQNRANLADSGYFIPQSLVFPPNEIVLNHGHLVNISMYDDTFNDPQLSQFPSFDHDDMERVRRDLFTTFSEEIAAAPQMCDTIILSSEQCHSRLVTSEEVQNLKDFLDHFCETYRIVVYLRPQHEIAMSAYGMLIANGILNIEMFPPLPPPPGYTKEIHNNYVYYDYQALLHRWSQVFGENALYPHIYEAGSLRGNDVVNDFAADLSLASGGLLLPPRRNTNTSARGQALLIYIYRHFRDMRQFGAGLLRERLRNAVSERFPGTGPLPTRAETLAFFGQFTEGNEAIRARWFPQRRRLFEINFNEFPEVASPVVLTEQEIMDMIIEVLLKDQELGFSLTPDSLRRMQDGLPPNTQ